MKFMTEPNKTPTCKKYGTWRTAVPELLEPVRAYIEKAWPGKFRSWYMKVFTWIIVHYFRNVSSRGHWFIVVAKACFPTGTYEAHSRSRHMCPSHYVGTGADLGATHILRIFSDTIHFDNDWRRRHLECRQGNNFNTMNYNWEQNRLGVQALASFFQNKITLGLERKLRGNKVFVVFWKKVGGIDSAQFRKDS